MTEQRPNRFQIDQTDFLFDRVTKQVNLVLTAKFVAKQIRRIAFLALAYCGILGHHASSLIHIGSDIVI